MAIEIISSSFSSLMPRTPVESRPLNTRTSSTGNRMQRPCAVVSSTFSSGLQIATRTMRSPSSSFMAILPLRLMFSKSARLLRRTLPALVANISSSCPQVFSSSGSSRIEVMYSPSSRGSRLTSALPTDCGVAAGSRHTFMR